MVEYRQGLLSFNSPNLVYISYSGKNSLTKSTILAARDAVFIVSVREKKGVQFVYVICPNRILIKEDYATNYQTLEINATLTQKMALSSYAISEKILTLLYVNSTLYLQLFYDLTAIYPKLIDTFIEPNLD